MKIELDGKEHSITRHADHWLFNDTRVEADLVQLDELSYHLLKDGVSYRIYVESIDTEDKVLRLQVNGRTLNIKAVGRYAHLLKSLGMDDLTSSKAKDLKAPMPGLVLEVSAEAGQEVKNGDTLLVLEAMKMENVIKATADGVVGAVLVAPAQSVEKGEVLIRFEN